MKGFSRYIPGLVSDGVLANIPDMERGDAIIRRHRLNLASDFRCRLPPVETKSLGSDLCCLDCSE